MFITGSNSFLLTKILTITLDNINKNEYGVLVGVGNIPVKGTTGMSGNKIVNENEDKLGMRKNNLYANQQENTPNAAYQDLLRKYWLKLFSTNIKINNPTSKQQQALAGHSCNGQQSLESHL
jgi:hypothetical protein